MSQTLECPSCKKAVRAEPEHAGKKVRCPSCKKPFMVPGIAPTTNDDDDWLSLDDEPKSKPASSTKSKSKTTVPSSEQDDAALRDALAGVGGNAQDASGFGDGDFSPPSDDDDPFGDLPPVPPPAKAGAAPPKATSVEYQHNYRVRCKVCESPSDVTADQAGQTISCHDCHSPMVVPPPPKVKKKTEVNLDQAATFQFSEAPGESRPADPFMKSARELLDSAEQEEVEEEPEDYETPEVGKWLADVFGIYKNPSVVMFTLVFSCVMGGIAAMVGFFVLIPTLFGVLAVSALLMYGLVVAHAFTIMEAIANDAEEINAWPEVLDPGTWIMPMLYCFAAAGIVATPLGLLSGVLFDSYLASIFLIMFSIFALFPFVLLSMLDMQSMFTPFSPEVSRSVTRGKESWAGFYFSSAVLFGAIYLLFVLFDNSESSLGWVASAIVLVVGTFLYFAMLGRLAYSIGQVVQEDLSLTSDTAEEPNEHSRRTTIE